MNMARYLRVPTCILVAMLFLVPLSLIGEVSGASSRITTFPGGANSVDLTFEEAGTNTNTYLNLPRGCTVNDASISIEGSVLKARAPTTRDLTYNDMTNTSYYWGWTSENISNTVNGPGQWEEYNENTWALGSDDGNYQMAPEGQGNGQGQGGGNGQGQGGGGIGPGQGQGQGGSSFVYQQFIFKVSLVDITKITIKWNGYAYLDDWTYWTSSYGAQLYIWNDVNQAWEELGQYDDGNTTGATDHWITKTLTGSLDPYLYKTNEIRVLGSNLYSDNGYPEIFSDFIEARVDGKTYSFPNEVKIDVGNDGSVDWTHLGTLDDVQTFSGSGLWAVLQNIMNHEGPGYGDLKVPLAVSTTEPGMVRLGNISIGINDYKNRAPYAMDIPSTYHFPEDTSASGLIDLSSYFTDDLDKSSELTYALVSETDPQYLHATVSAQGSMGFTTPTRFWSGSATFEVSAKDEGGLTTVSQSFQVRADPVPNPPVLTPIGPLTFTEGQPSVLKVQATDPDNLFGGQDQLTYAAHFLTGRPFFTLESTTGFALFTPTMKDVGTYSVNFTVTDSHGLTASETVDVKVVRPDYQLALSPIDKQTIDEGKPYDLQLRTKEKVEPEQSPLTFTVTFQDGASLFTMGPDGHISFVPVKRMVGVHQARFEVTDPEGNRATEDVVFEVRNVNSPPVLSPIPDLKAVCGSPVHLKAYATDEDIGIVQESLTFSDDTNIFAIDEGTGWMNFTPTKDSVGKHEITVTVTDMNGAWDTRTFGLEVRNNPASLVQIIVDGNRTKVKEGDTVHMTAQATDMASGTMTYKWTEDGKELGTGKELTMKGLKAGKHTVTVEVSDGITKVSTSRTIEVEKAKFLGIPGFDAGTVIMALSLVGLISLAMARRKR
jgi:hypothetical protein